jgi:hypothetical protein
VGVWGLSAVTAISGLRLGLQFWAAMRRMTLGAHRVADCARHEIAPLLLEGTLAGGVAFRWAGCDGWLWIVSRARFVAGYRQMKAARQNVSNHATMEKVKGPKATILIQRVLRHFTMIRPESSTRSVQSASPASTSVIASLGSRQTSKAPSASRSSWP